MDPRPPGARRHPGSGLVGPERAGATAGAAASGRPTVPLETGRKRPEAALRLAAAGWRGWGWSPRRKATAMRKRTRLRPWNARRRACQSARRVRRGPRSLAASPGVNEEGGAGGRPGRGRQPLGCDRPRPAWFPSASWLCSEGCPWRPRAWWLRPGEGWLHLAGVWWARRFLSRGCSRPSKEPIASRRGSWAVSSCRGGETCRPVVRGWGWASVRAGRNGWARNRGGARVQ